MSLDRESEARPRLTKQSVAETLRRMGFAHAADEALRVLPDHVDDEAADRFCRRHGVFREDLISWMGGSP